MKPRPDLATEVADGELIILDKAAGKVHQLNSSASFIWHCIGDGLETADIALELSDAFGVERESAFLDVEEVVARFLALELVQE